MHTWTWSVTEARAALMRQVTVGVTDVALSVKAVQESEAMSAAQETVAKGLRRLGRLRGSPTVGDRRWTRVGGVLGAGCRSHSPTTV
jgi:hypothetical protein